LIKGSSHKIVSITLGLARHKVNSTTCDYETMALVTFGAAQTGTQKSRSRAQPQERHPAKPPCNSPRRFDSVIALIDPQLCSKNLSHANAALRLVRELI
jgi:hypothetical protein